MGYMRHHCIVVTGFTESPEFMDLHEKAVEIFPIVSPITPVAVNGYVSFFIPPDGSKEWWDESNMGDARRDAFVEILRRTRCVDWVELQYADEQGDNKIIRQG